MVYQQRLKRAQELLSKFHVDALVVDHPINLFYLTGLDLSSGKIVILPNAASLFVDGRYLELCKKVSPIPPVLAQDRAFLDFLLSRSIQRLGFDSEKTSYKSYLDMHNSLKEIGKNGGNPPQLTPLENPLQSLRSIKDSTEQKLLEEAANLGSQGFDYVCSLLKQGISEEEAASKLEIFWKERGGKGAAFEPIIAFGPNSSMPHYRAGKERLKQGMPVLIDIGVTLQHYHSDMTRTLFFGKPDPKLVEIYGIVKDAQQMALDLCRPGVKVGELDETARGFIASKGYGEAFMHSLGHGIGLDVHESPLLRNKAPHKDVVLEPGMAITIEPGVYLPGLGGVRIEDTIIITEKGYKNLTNRDKSLTIINK